MELSSFNYINSKQIRFLFVFPLVDQLRTDSITNKTMSTSNYVYSKSSSGIDNLHNTVKVH
jgi:hypothetical protein